MDQPEEVTDAASIAEEIAEEAARLLPLEMLDTVADLADPKAITREMPWLTGELTKIVLGKSDIWFDERDARFADPAWRSYPYFHMMGQSYRLYEMWIDRICEGVDGSWQRQARARFVAELAKSAMAPTNTLAGNPAALRKAAETDGLSLLRGAQNMLRDMARGGMPLGADRKSFPVGEKIAATPGAVVHRDEMFELLQYTPTTPKVRSIPLVMVPPQVNRHYILDLAPGRSLAEFAVSQGIQTFMIVWRNPSALRGEGRWGLEDYISATERAGEIAKKITRSDKLNWLGLCAGGMTTSFMLGHLNAIGDDSANSATFIVTMLSGKQPNVVGIFDSSQGRAELETAAKKEQMLSSNSQRTLFAWLRPNDLVFNYMISGWLLGESPRPFDVLAWNDDSTRTTVKFALDTTKLVVDGWEGIGPTLLGVQTDLSEVSCDSFHVAGYTDHITRWRACYSTTQILGGSKELAVVKSGHVQSIISPAQTGRYGCWDGPVTTADPDEWLTTATERKGSWWQRWTEWLIERSGSERQAHATLGNREYPPIGKAPGTYVYE